MGALGGFTLLFTHRVYFIKKTWCDGSAPRSRIFRESSGVFNRRVFNCGQKDADMCSDELIPLVKGDCVSSRVCVGVLAMHPLSWVCSSAVVFGVSSFHGDSNYYILVGFALNLFNEVMNQMSFCASYLLQRCQ